MAEWRGTSGGGLQEGPGRGRTVGRQLHKEGMKTQSGTAVGLGALNLSYPQCFHVSRRITQQSVSSAGHMVGFSKHYLENKVMDVSNTVNEELLFTQESVIGETNSGWQ